MQTAATTAGPGGEAASAPRRRDPGGLRPFVAAMAGLVLIQAAVGMVVNLYVEIPANHPGADPSNYFTGSYHSVAWALSQSPVALASHAGLGLIAAVGAIGVAALSLRHRSPWVKVLSWLAAGLVVGAGFNGASFVDFGHDYSSLIMALLAFGAVACYVLILDLLPARSRPR